MNPDTSFISSIVKFISSIVKGVFLGGNSFIRTLRAVEISHFFTKGEERICSMAFSTLFSPVPKPLSMVKVPLSARAVFRSCTSILISSSSEIRAIML